MRHPTRSVDERRRTILSLLTSRDMVTTMELCRAFGISEVSVRKDLDYLDRRGLLKRTHGGAHIVDASSPVLVLADRYMENRRAKEAIAREGAKLLSSANLRVYLDTGTTVLQLARLVPEDLPLMVYTNSLTTISALEGKTAAQVYFLGGRVDFRTRSVLGPILDEQIDRLRFDLCFLGAESVSSEGFGCADIETANTLRRVISRASSVCVLADAAIAQRRNSAVYAAPADVKTWITDARISLELHAAMTGGGVDVITTTTP